ncbi:hypothetical protein TA3x_003914 [Tundrisphaera sp. TA3]|uniref:hypothetical protein n=1 Tax=Tundrisphaera sp. TA3 TaxID=3435775 RepID=UPI003EBB69AE
MPPRRFTIADGMILVPAAALGALMLRAYLPGHYRQLAIVPTLIPDPWGAWRVHAWVRGPGSCFVVPVMAALIVLRLRPPRPGRIRSQPGFVACLAVMLAVLVGVARVATIFHRPSFHSESGFEQIWGSVTARASWAVMGAWLALHLSGDWDAEPSWVDRAGRLLGVFWIAPMLMLLGAQWLDRLVELCS